MINTGSHVEQTNSEMGALTDAELEAINGGSIIGDFARFIARAFLGNGDARRSTS
jgi:hypothetical protein